jgi:hypothetical protein
MLGDYISSSALVTVFWGGPETTPNGSVYLIFYRCGTGEWGLRVKLLKWVMAMRQFILPTGMLFFAPPNIIDSAKIYRIGRLIN